MNIHVSDEPWSVQSSNLIDELGTVRPLGPKVLARAARVARRVRPDIADEVLEILGLTEFPITEGARA